jgi:hypothetical protein
MMVNYKHAYKFEVKLLVTLLNIWTLAMCIVKKVRKTKERTELKGFNMKSNG